MHLDGRTSERYFVTPIDYNDRLRLRRLPRWIRWIDDAGPYQRPPQKAFRRSFRWHCHNTAIVPF